MRFAPILRPPTRSAKTDIRRRRTKKESECLSRETKIDKQDIENCLQTTNEDSKIPETYKLMDNIMQETDDREGNI